MATFSDTFTQGGQTQIHKFHMIRQVIGTTAKVGLLIFALTFVLFMCAKHSWQDFWFLLCYLKAFVRVEYFSFCPKGFLDESWIVYVNGHVHTVSDYYLMHNEAYINLKNTICLSVFRHLVYSILISSVGLAAVSWFWVKMGRKKQATKILSGFECVLPKALIKIVRKAGASPYTIGTVPIPKNAEFQHMMVTGTTGAGKSNMIHQLLHQIRDQGDQAIVVDTTGGIFSRFYDMRTDLLLNPLDIRSAKWNLWDEVTNDYVVDEIAEAMIPDTKTMDSFWITGARQLLVESIRYLRTEKSRSYENLIKMTLTISLKELQRRLVDTTVSALLDPAIDKTALSVRASLANHLKVVKDLEDTNEGLSLLNFMKENHKQWLFLSCQPDQRSYVKPLFSTWLSLIIKGMMARSENNGARTWIIIDELASLSRLPSLMLGLAEIRKYGGCFVLGFQDISQLEDIYGHSASKTLSNLTGTKVLFRAVDTEVATRVARYLGEHEKEEASESISFGAHQMRDGVNLTHQKQTKPVVNASQIMQLKDLEAYLKFPGNFPVAKIEFSYLKLPVQTAVYVEKPLKLIKKEEKMNENEVLSNIVHLNFKEENPESNKGGEDEESPTLSEKSEHEIGEKEMRETSAEISELTI
jgi:type IV conjugative transfer system coupling protein TraD